MYTHGPVTGSGPSVVPSTVVELRVPLSSLPPPLFSQCEYHGPPIGVGREKNGTFSISTRSCHDFVNRAAFKRPFKFRSHFCHKSGKSSTSMSKPIYSFMRLSNFMFFLLRTYELKWIPGISTPVDLEGCVSCNLSSNLACDDSSQDQGPASILLCTGNIHCTLLQDFGWLEFQTNVWFVQSVGKTTSMIVLIKTTAGAGRVVT